MRADRAAQIYFAAGAPGSGKTHYLKSLLTRLNPGRLIVVDPDGEYDGYGTLQESPADLMRATLFPTFRARVRPSYIRATAERQFAFFCELVRWHADPQPGQAPPPAVGPVTLLVDELAEFVGPSFREAPESWQWVVRRGRKYGVTVLAASQRPAEIDKKLFDLASHLRTGRLNNPDSQKTMADALAVPLDQVRALLDVQALERDKLTGALRATPAGILTPGKARRARGR